MIDLSVFLRNKPRNLMGLKLCDYLVSITATFFMNLPFVETTGIEASIEYKT